MSDPVAPTTSGAAPDAVSTATSLAADLSGLANTIGRVLLVMSPVITGVILVVFLGTLVVRAHRKKEQLELTAALQVTLGGFSLAASFPLLSAFVLTTPPAVDLIDKTTMTTVGVMGFLSMFVFGWRETFSRCFPKRAPVAVTTASSATAVQAPPPSPLPAPPSMSV